MISSSEQPLFVMRENSVLVSAHLTPNSETSALLATDLSVTLYRRDASGSGQIKLAYIDRNATGATAWAPFRKKELVVSGSTIIIAEGELVTIAFDASTSVTSVLAALTMRFRRVDA